jgi:hypothetical protein
MEALGELPMVVIKVIVKYVFTQNNGATLIFISVLMLS